MKETSDESDGDRANVRLRFMAFTIRRASVDDARAIAVVHVESWRTTYSGIVPDAFIAGLSEEKSTETWKEQRTDGDGFLFVAEDQSGIFGFVSGGKLRAALEGYDGELYAIYLLRAYQRQGAGRLLVNALTEAMRGKGFMSMAVWVLAQNPAVSFYKRLGAIQIAKQTIEIGGVQLTELAFGWPTLDSGLN